MASVILKVALITTYPTATSSIVQDNTCRKACSNCQFSNVQALDLLIEAKIASALANRPSEYYNLYQSENVVYIHACMCVDIMNTIT